MFKDYSEKVSENYDNLETAIVEGKLKKRVTAYNAVHDLALLDMSQKYKPLMIIGCQWPIGENLSFDLGGAKNIYIYINDSERDFSRSSSLTLI